MGQDDSPKEVKERGCLKDKPVDVFSQHLSQCISIFYLFHLSQVQHVTFICLFIIYSSKTYLLSIYYVTGTLLNPEDIVMNKVNRFSGLTEPRVYGGDRHGKKR